MNKIFLIGHEISHSKSETIQNAALNYLGINCLYETKDIKPEHFQDFLKVFDNENVIGANITKPYKKEISKYFNHSSPANTLYKLNNEIKLTSTDFQGFKKCFDDLNITFNDYEIILLGSGGVSESFEIGFNDIGKDTTKVSRSSEKTYSNFYQWKDKKSIIINCTPLGSGKYINESPLEFFENDDIIFDCNYNPIGTKFIKLAKNYNCLTISGIEMLLNQAIYSLEFFLNIKLDFEDIKKVMKNSLKKG